MDQLELSVETVEDPDAGDDARSEGSWMVVEDGTSAPVDQTGDLKSYNVITPVYTVSAAGNGGAKCSAGPKITSSDAEEESDFGFRSGCENENDNNSLSCGSSMVIIASNEEAAVATAAAAVTKEPECDVHMSVKGVIGPSSVGTEAADLFQGCWMDSLNNAVWVDRHLMARFRRLRRRAVLTLKIRFKDADAAWYCGNGVLVCCNPGVLTFETKDGRMSYWRRPTPAEYDKFFWNRRSKIIFKKEKEGEL